VLTGEQVAVADAYRKWFDTPTLDAIASKTEGGEGLRTTIAALPGKVPVAPYTITVQAVRLVGADHALVTFTLFTPYGTYLPDTQGGAVKVDGHWLVSRATFCGVVAIVDVECPVG